MNDLSALELYAPSALTGTITIEVSPDGGTSWFTKQSGGSDISIAANKAVTIEPSVGNLVRLKSGSAEASARTFLAYGVWENR